MNASSGRFKREIVRALGTPDERTASRRVLPHIAQAEGIIEDARRFLREGPQPGITPEQVTSLIQEHEIQLLSGDEKLRRAGIGVDLQLGETRPDHAGMTDDDLQVYKFTTEFLDHELRTASAKMRPPDYVQNAVEKALVSRGITLASDDPARRELELGFVAAQRRAFDTIRARLQGEIIETPKAREPGRSAITLTQALERWAAGGGKGAKTPRTRSVEEARSAVTRFIELHGDLTITAISRAHGREFRDALSRLPKNLPAALAKQRLPELLKRDFSGFPARNAQTINKAVNLLSGILARADRDGFFDELPTWTNPFRVRLEISAAEREPYEPFTNQELKKLFSSPVLTEGERPLGGRGEAAYWLPLIALYSGARRTEIAQLKARDIRQIGGVWIFDFTATSEYQHVKNLSSARLTPVHPELIRLGLLDWVEQRVKKGPATPLWTGFEPPVAPKAAAFSKWFGRWLNEYVTDAPSRTFHSLRHGFARAAREAGLSEEFRHALTGHSGGGVGRAYGRERGVDGTLDRGIPLPRLAAEIAKVSYPGLEIAAPQTT